MLQDDFMETFYKLEVVSGIIVRQVGMLNIGYRTCHVGCQVCPAHLCLEDVVKIIGLLVCLDGKDPDRVLACCLPPDSSAITLSPPSR